MEYWSNTTNNSDALKLCEERWRRIKENPSYAKEVVLNSGRYAHIIKDIKQNSCCIVKNLLDKNLINNLRNDAFINLKSNLSGMKVRDHRNEVHSKNMELLHITLNENDTLDSAKKITNGISIKNPLIALPSIVEILDNQQLQGIVTGFYESIPQLTFVKTRISFFDSIGPRDTQFWHCDPGSFSVLKALIYLNDVDEDGGPFEIIKGSHINKFKGWDNSTRHEQKDLENIYNKELFKKCTASVGDVIFADATAFHRGNLPIKKNRLILILNFCLHDEYGLPFEKVKIKKENYDKTQGIAKTILNKLDVI